MSMREGWFGFRRLKPLAFASCGASLSRGAPRGLSRRLHHPLRFAVSSEVGSASSIAVDFGAKRSDAEKQVAQLKSDEKAELIKLLTDDQKKQLLKHLTGDAPKEQAKKNDKAGDSKNGKKPTTLPPEWESLKLTHEQREMLLAVVDRYSVKANDAARRLEALRWFERAEMVKRLTDEQKAILLKGLTRDDTDNAKKNDK
jgi:hypothetical protein